MITFFVYLHDKMKKVGYDLYATISESLVDDIYMIRSKAICGKLFLWTFQKRLIPINYTYKNSEK